MSSLKFQTIKKSFEFDKLYKTAKRWHRDSFIIFYKKSDITKVGFVASKKVGNAVKRNFSKRRLKALVKEYKDLMQVGEYIFVAKKRVQEEDFSVLRDDFVLSLKKLNALK